MKRNYFIILLASVLLLILVGLLVAKNNSKVNSSQSKLGPQTVSLKGFKSNNLDFSVQIPMNYSGMERLTYAEFRLGDDFIEVGRTDASGFGSLDDYLAYADKKSKLESVTEINKFEINGYPVAGRTEVRGGISGKIYYIYADNWVYAFSTTSEKLYSDLDQITQSFRYTP